jgi:hypothetical protein
MQAWQDFLDSHPATTTAAQPQSALSGNGWSDLSHLTTFRLSGADTIPFLQGQLSSNLQRLSADMSQLSSYSSPKGRMLALFRLLMAEDGSVVVVLPRSVAAPTRKRLQMFVLRSAVTFSDSEAGEITLGLTGAASAERLQRHFGTIPQHDNATCHSGHTLICRIAGEQPRFLLLTDEVTALTLLQDESTPLQRFDSGLWDLHDIHAGIPTVESATVEAFVPQMTNLQLLGGVSFKKGCYTGQEVVARMQYLGKLKRRMYRLHSQSSSAPAIGDEISSPHSSSGQGAGKVVQVAPSAEGGYDMLAVVEIAALEQGELQLANSSAPLTLRDLPYDLDAEGITQQ